MASFWSLVGTLCVVCAMLNLQVTIFAEYVAFIRFQADVRSCALLGLLLGIQHKCN